jgi:hypothetical protein
MSAELKLVFLTPYAHGHSNVHLTIFRHLLREKPRGVSHLSLHVIGDETVRKRLAPLPTSSAHCDLTFHPMATDDYISDFLNDMDTLRQPPPSFVRKDGLKMFSALVAPTARDPDTFLSRYGKIVKVLEEVKPDLMVVDMLYRALGVDACKTVGVEYVILSPGPTIDFAVMGQPQGRGFWYYPAYVLFLCPTS